MVDYSASLRVYRKGAPTVERWASMKVAPKDAKMAKIQAVSSAAN